MAGQKRTCLRRVILAGTGLSSCDFQVTTYGKFQLPRGVLPLHVQQEMMAEALRKANFSTEKVEEIMTHRTTLTGLAKTLGLPGLLSVHVKVQAHLGGGKLQAYASCQMHAHGLYAYLGCLCLGRLRCLKS